MRLYDEEQIGSILKRAAELSTSDDSQISMGLSLEELKQLGAEAGLDPALIAVAARELSNPAYRGRETNFWGGPYSLTSDIIFDRSISAGDWEAMLPEIRRHFGDPGIVATRGTTYEWTHSGSSDVRGHVSIREVDGRSQVSVFWTEPSIVAAFFVPMLVLSLVALPILLKTLAMSGLALAAALVAVVSTLFFLARFGVTKMYDKRAQGIEDLLIRLEDIADTDSDREPAGRSEASDRSSVTTPTVDSETGSPLIDLQADEAPSYKQTRRSRSRRRRG
jgi:hypothetical protein